ncbi:MAG: 2-oxoacid:acceptor oxidoreductase family protein, partial [Nanoarchaeota archaeon]
AGHGPNILTHTLGEALVKQGFYSFYSRDYQSLIRGGHNFNVLTFSEEPVYSNEDKLDIIVALDENTEKMHKPKLKKNGIILKGCHENMYFAGLLFKALGLDFKILEEELKILEKRFDENIKEAKQGYSDGKNGINLVKAVKREKVNFMNGTQGIAKGAVKSGLDIYYAYPMTPATPLLGELAEKQIEKNYLVLELENEISVINAAIGSSITGAKSMIGTSGGGFDLMTEALSLSGIAEVPLVIFLSQRPGPATGVATYTSQGDLNIARHSGHGEFQRVVLAPGDPAECEELTNQGFYFSQKFKIPTIILSDKHLGESFYTIDQKINLIESEKSTSIRRYNSYEIEHVSNSATDNPEIIKKNVEDRIKKGLEIEKEAEKFNQYDIYGNKNSKNVILSWGSTKGAVIDAIKGLDAKFIQVKYIEPFPKSVEKEIKNKNLILVENNSTAQLGSLIAEKTGIFVDDKNKILKYDGRPFIFDELKKEIEGRLG